MRSSCRCGLSESDCGGGGCHCGARGGHRHLLRKDRHHGRVFKQKKNKPRSGGQGRLLEAGPEPSGKLGDGTKHGLSYFIVK